MSTHQPDKPEIKFERAEDVILLREYERARAAQDAAAAEERRFREREHQASLDRETAQAKAAIEERKAREQAEYTVRAKEAEAKRQLAEKEYYEAFYRTISGTWWKICAMLLAAAAAGHAYKLIRDRSSSVATAPAAVSPVPPAPPGDDVAAAKDDLLRRLAAYQTQRSRQNTDSLLTPAHFREAHSNAATRVSSLASLESLKSVNVYSLFDVELESIRRLYGVGRSRK